MHERELNNLLLTWGGMLWCGNPAIRSSKHITELTHSVHGDVYTGVTCLRYATGELVNLYVKFMNGLVVQYSNYHVPDFELVTLDQRCGVIQNAANPYPSDNAQSRTW